MKNKDNVTSPALWILAVILGVAVFKQINFENLNFKHTGLGILYLLTFLALIFFIVKRKKLNN